MKQMGVPANTPVHSETNDGTVFWLAKDEQGSVLEVGDSDGFNYVKSFKTDEEAQQYIDQKGGERTK